VDNSVRERWEVAVNGGWLTEDKVVRDGALPGDMANGSSCNQVPEATSDATEFLADSGSDGRARC
jgi:hypothetical protein